MRRRPCLFLAGALFFCSSVLGQDVPREVIRREAVLVKTSMDVQRQLAGTKAKASLPFILDFSGAKAGSYYYRIVVNADGTAELSQLRTVVVVGGSGDPSPVPDPNDPNDPNDPPNDPPNSDTIAEKVERLARETNDPDLRATATALITIYRRTRQLAETQAFGSKGQVITATDTLYNAALGSVNKVAMWQNWKTEVDHLAIEANSMAEVIQIWKSVEAGLAKAIQ